MHNNLPGQLGFSERRYTGHQSISWSSCQKQQLSGAHLHTTVSLGSRAPKYSIDAGITIRIQSESVSSANQAVIQRQVWLYKRHASLPILSNKQRLSHRDLNCFPTISNSSFHLSAYLSTSTKINEWLIGRTSKPSQRWCPCTSGKPPETLRPNIDSSYIFCRAPDEAPSLTILRAQDPLIHNRSIIRDLDDFSARMSSNFQSL